MSTLLVNFKSLPTNEKLFVSSLLILCVFYIYQLFYMNIYTLFSLCLLVITLILIYQYLKKYSNNPKLWYKREVFLLSIILFSIVYLPLTYLVSARICGKKPLKDEYLLKIDNFFLGWLFEDGQISFALDKNTIIGPTKRLGIFINSVLQIFYFSYYIIPYVGIYFILYPPCIRELIFRKKNNGVMSNSHDSKWNKLFLCYNTYTLTFTTIFFINTLVPASSPRLFYKHKYTNEITLAGVAKICRGVGKDNKGANSFPSGHVGETLSIAICLIGCEHKVAGWINLFSSFLIFLATLFLRYHYVIDAVAAIIICWFAFLLCYYLGYKKRGEEDVGNIDGLKMQIESGVKDEETKTENLAEKKYEIVNIL